jgi:hypothetical protein
MKPSLGFLKVDEFSGTRLQNTHLPLSTVWLLESLAESKRRQQSFSKTSPHLLTTPIEMALTLDPGFSLQSSLKDGCFLLEGKNATAFERF